MHLLRFLVAFFATSTLILTAGVSGAAANHEQFGVCHRTEGVNAFVYISPDQSSSHLNDEEIGHPGDRAATEAEFLAGECFADQPTEVPTEVPTEEPTSTPVTPTATVPGPTATLAPGVTPTATPVTPTVTPVTPVNVLPSTGSSDNGSGPGSTGVLLLVAGTSLLLAGAALTVQRSKTRQG